MKQFFQFVLLVPLFAFFITSCSQNDFGNPMSNVYLSLGFVETENTSEYDFIILTDEGDTLVPITNEVPFFQISNKQRVVANYTILNEIGISKKKFQVQINNLREILYKDIIELSTSNSDSLGNDPVHVTNIWLADSLLNVEFQYIGGNQVHYINLALDKENTNLSDTISLRFLHNANDDIPSLTINGLVTFNLKTLKKAEHDSVIFQMIYTDYQNESHNITGTYIY